MILPPAVRIIRLEEHDPFGTFGQLLINGQVFCATLELPDRLNRPSMSSIPAQQYFCLRISSHTFGVTFEVTKVPGRSSILFHPGNTANDTKGCILLGQFIGKLRGDKDTRAVLNSGNTFKCFMEIMKDHVGFHLTIKEHY